MVLRPRFEKIDFSILQIGCLTTLNDLTTEVAIGAEIVIDHMLYKCTMQGSQVFYSYGGETLRNYAQIIFVSAADCKYLGKFYKIDEMWTNNYIKYQCFPDGGYKAIGTFEAD